MTGGSNIGEKARATILTFVMVTSMMFGTVALTGTAAAASDGTATDVDTGGVFLDPGSDNNLVQEVTITDSGSGDSGSLVIDRFQLTKDSGSLTGADIDAIELYQDGGDGNFDAGSGDDTQIGSTNNPSGSIGTVNFLSDDDGSSTSVSIADGTSETFFVSIDVASSASADGDSITTKLDASDLTSSSTSSFSGDGAEVASSPAELDLNPSISSATTADSNDNGQIDQVTLSFSENVNVIDGSSSDGIPGLSLGSDLGNNYQIVDRDYSATGTSSVTVDVVEIGASNGDTNAQPQVDYTQSSSFTDADQQNKDTAATTISNPTDGAAPVLLSAVRQSGANQVRVTFSEPVTDDDGAAGDSSADETALEAADDFGYSNNNGAGASGLDSVSDAGSSASDGIVDVFTTGSLTSSDIGTDQINAVAGGGSSGADVGIDDQNNGNAALTNSVVITSPSLAGGTAAGAQFEVGGDGSADVVAGSANESLGEIKLRDDPANSDAAFAGQTQLTFPDGITVNTSASDLSPTTVITSQNDGVDVTGVSVTNNDRTITIDHSGTSNNGEEIRVGSGAVVLDVNASAIDTSGTSTSFAVELDTFSGTEDMSGFLSVKSPNANDVQNSIDAGSENLGPTSVTIGSDALDADIEGTEETLVGNQTDIVLSLQEGNGVSFDTSNTAATLASQDLNDGDSDNELSESDITVTESEVRVPVVDAIGTSASNDITVNGLRLTTTGDATNADLNVSVTAPNPNNGAYVLDDGSPDADADNSDGSDDDSSTIDDFASIVNPDVTVDDSTQNLAVGLDEQVLTEGGTGLSSNVALEVEDTNDGQIASGTNVTIGLNSSAVTFDTSQAINIDRNGLDNANDIQNDPANNDPALDIGFSDTQNTDADVDAVTINENSIEISVTNGATQDDDSLLLGDVGLNVSNTAADDADVEFTATTKSSAAAPAVTTVSTATKNDGSNTDSNQFRTLERANVEFPDATNIGSFDANSNANVTFDVDGDGFEQQEVTGADGALLIKSNELGQIADDTNVTISLEENTGVTFDTQAPTGTGSFDAGDSDGPNGGSEIEARVNGGDSEITIDDIEIKENELVLELSDDTDSSDGPDVQHEINSPIQVDDLRLNVSAGASTTAVSVTTNATVSNPTTANVDSSSGTSGVFTSGADNEVTTTLDAVLKPSTVEPSEIRVDPDTSSNANNFDPTSFTFGADQQVDKPQVTNTISSGLEVQDGGSGFGDATVTLEIIETPNGSSGAQLNTTQVSTNSNGNAFYNFTAGDTAGDYVVNATVEQTGAGVNVTYTAQPGGIDGVTVTPIENAIAQDGTGDTAVAALFVNSTDANGNKVTGSSPTVEISADNVGSSEVDSTDNFENTKGDVSGINSGTFSLDSADGSSVIYVKSSQVEDVTISATISGNSDSGTVTFFDQVSQIDLALNQSTVEVDDTVAAEATLSESDGTTIEVPDVTVNYDDNNNGNTTFAGGADSDSASTNDAGVASVNVTAEQLGSSTIDAQSNLRSDNATLNIVENAGAQVQLANINLDPSSVSANTTNDHDLTFDAVNVSDDGNTDSFTVTIPSAATLESANSVSVVDANGADVSLSGGPDVSGNEITFDVAPDSSADTRTLSVTANVTVAAPDVENETTADITVDVSDSNNGQDSADVTLTVEPADADPEDRFDTNGEPGIQSEEVLNAISAFNEDTRIGGEPVESGDVLDVISAFNEA